MFRSKLMTTSLVVSVAFLAQSTAADTYGPFPITLKGYEGDATNSVSYGGQIARQTLEQSLKSLAAKGDGGANAAELEKQMLSYFTGPTAELPIIAPAGKDGFPILQKTVGELSGSANLEGKFYNGLMPAWAGNMTGIDVAKDMIARAAASKGGYDAENGFDYPQLISKFTMGAVQYSQAVDNYLDEKLAADVKPNNLPYSDGASYTGKEHSWDEAFGYFGAPAHATSLAPKVAYNVAKLADLEAADANGDGVVDLKTEMVFGPAYYAAGADTSGATNYLPTIVNAYIGGREVITAAAGEALTAEQLGELKAYASTIEDAWENVLAEAAFKYAGSVYKDIATMKDTAAEGDIYRTYVKHWGELKGFAMAIQSGRKNLGATAVELNKLIGYGPVTADNSYVTGVDADGTFIRDRRMTWSDYQLNMLKVQKLLDEQFSIKARSNDVLAELDALAGAVDAASNAETD